MIKSMTGYGRHKELIAGRDIMCEIKSVNSRYLDLNIKINRLYAPLEEAIRSEVSACISRGKTDVYVSVDCTAGEKVELALNREYLEGYLKQLSTIKNDYDVGGDITIGMIAGKSEVFIARRAEEDMEAVWEGMQAVLSKAIESFCVMREREGKKLCDDLITHIQTLEALAGQIKERSPKAVADSNARMKERIADLLAGAALDETKIITECAVFADKTDISEEISRLGSHFLQFRQILEENAPAGRKLDFLVQEINREINTIGSKCNDSDISKLVIEAKCTAEKIREQIQNIE